MFLLDGRGVREGTDAPLGGDAGFRGLAWSPDGKRLFASTSKDEVKSFGLEDGKLRPGPGISLKADPKDGNPVPGGIAITCGSSRATVSGSSRCTAAALRSSTSR